MYKYRKFCVMGLRVKLVQGERIQFVQYKTITVCLRRVLIKHETKHV